MAGSLSPAPPRSAAPVAEETAERRRLSLSSAADPAKSGVKWQALVAALLAVLVTLQYLLWLAEDGVRQTYALRIANQAQTEENAALNERNRALEADVIDLKNGLMAIEERARSEMGMIRPDETFYRILDQPLPQPKPAAIPAKPAAPVHKSPPPVKSAAAIVKPPAIRPSAPPALLLPVKPAAAPAKPPATRPSALPASSPPRIAKPSPNPAQPR